MDNVKLVQNLYHCFAEGKIQEVISFFDNEAVWVRPGEPDISFSGTFTGHGGMIKMLTLVQQTIRLKKFFPEKFYSDNNSVTVLGEDEAEVLTTGKSYKTKWVQVFQIRNEKIIHVQVYIDSLTIAKAMLP